MTGTCAAVLHPAPTGARPLARALREQALGSAHPDLASSLNNLARLYRAQGQGAESLPLYQRALAIREQALGVDYPEVAESLKLLARLNEARGLEAEALPLYQQASAILEHALPDHPTTATTRDHVSALVLRLKRAEASRPSE